MFIFNGLTDVILNMFRNILVILGVIVAVKNTRVIIEGKYPSPSSSPDEDLEKKKVVSSLRTESETTSRTLNINEKLAFVAVAIAILFIVFASI